MEDFLSQKNVARKLRLAFVFCAFASFLVASALYSGHFDLSYASDSIRFGQTISPYNPIKEVEIRKKEADKKTSATDSKYRVVVPISDEQPQQEMKNTKAVPEIASVVTFKGVIPYPEAPLLLEIHSREFIVALTSGKDGSWSWTNYGHPLESGEHSLETYSISPYEINGKKDVFAEKYFFAVNGDLESKAEQAVDVRDFIDSAYEEETGDQDLGDRFLSGNPQDTYFFTTNLLKRPSYNPGDALELELAFMPLGTGGTRQAEINYELYAESAEEGSRGELAYQGSDNVELVGDTAFLKKIQLKERLLDGEYVLKAAAKVGEDEYLQIQRFSTNSEKMIQIGETVITEEKFNYAILINILVALLVTSAILIILLLEYRRFSMREVVDEDILKGHGYFS